MSTPHQDSDQTTDGKYVEPDNMNEQLFSSKNESSVSPPSQDISSTVNSGVVSQPGSFGSSRDHTACPSNLYAPQAQDFYYRGFDSAPGSEWNGYSAFVSADGLEGVYNDNNSLMFHTGFGYNPQIPYDPYSPVTTPVPSVGGDTQIYSQQFPYSGPPYYQQLVSPTMPYINSPTQVTQSELTALVTPDQQGDGIYFRPRPGYSSSLGSIGTGNFPGNAGTLGFHDVHHGFDGFRSGGLWPDWPKAVDNHRHFGPLSPILSPQTIGALGSFGNVAMPTQQQISYGFGSASNSYNRGHIHGPSNNLSSFGSASISSLGMNSRAWLTFDNAKRRGRGNICSCNGILDVLSEQNRGPRASKPKKQNTGEINPNIENNKNGLSTFKGHNQLYNRTDFITKYDDAKFFVIKSYSEDNVHKSIKYSVWASTPNGNKKLDAAYHDAKKTQGVCPVFLLFSVNASAQFCGVAEMLGPVDFDRSVDYWQQDKWSGQFPVKWHIIKDIPNSQFRHIVLENNDNKPVTNSRDTQEVKLEQGTAMLTIFKTYETELSILDDFDFYENRQQAMQERKARQHAMSADVGVLCGKERGGSIPTSSNELVMHMSKSFAQVCLEEPIINEVQPAERGNSPHDVSDGSQNK